MAVRVSTLLLLVIAVSTGSSSMAKAAAYQMIDGNWVNPIQVRFNSGGGPHPYSGPHLEPFAVLTGAVLSSADLRNANLSSALLGSSDMSGALLTGMVLDSGELSGANLTVADLTGADISGTNLTVANLTGTDLSGANLASVIGLPTTIGAAFYDLNTNLSATGFDPAAAGWAFVDRDQRTDTKTAFYDSSSDTRFFFIAPEDVQHPSSVYDVNVEVTFWKCAGEIFGECTAGTPFHNEIVLILTSPSGTVVPLIAEGTFSEGTAPFQGTITFDQIALQPVNVNPALPQDGTFRPVGNLNDLNGEDPIGAWSLYVADTAFFDGLSFFNATLYVATVENGEVQACGDGIDNDGDGLIDLDDPGCESPADPTEKDETGTYPCDDGVDNDLDGYIDYIFDADGDGISDAPGDPACKHPAWPRENSACQDGLDNDGQPGTDFDGGESILGVGNGDPAGPDPQCVGSPWRNREAPGSCGLLGLEVAVPLGWLFARRRRQRTRASGAVP